MMHFTVQGGYTATVQGGYTAMTPDLKAPALAQCVQPLATVVTSTSHAGPKAEDASAQGEKSSADQSLSDNVGNLVFG